jgi:hypothetical protein
MVVCFVCVRRIKAWGAVVLAALLVAAALSVRVEAALNCTFTVKYPIISVRSGPGQEYERVGFARMAQKLVVTDQSTGKDGYVWWKGDQGWVRSDLGTSDCPATCGNSVCEYGESASSCAQDCQNSGSVLRSTGQGCLVPDSQSCYKSISCYPSCSECSCWLNEFGCVTCNCRYPGSSTSSAAASAVSTPAPSSQCKFASCEACYAAFPCWPEPCSNKKCSLNEYGCPICSTNP